jgi:hypothetical protein
MREFAHPDINDEYRTLFVDRNEMPVVAETALVTAICCRIVM